jgi:hypothetical protein
MTWLHKPQPVLTTWQTPCLQLLKPRPTRVLFNPNAFAVCEEVRRALAHFSEIEFLPLEIAGIGTFFIIYVVMAVGAPDGCSLRRSPVSNNIVELLAFPKGYAPSANFFRVAQPINSAAGLAGFCLNTIYTNAAGAQSVTAACRGYLDAIKVVDDRHIQ